MFANCYDKNMLDITFALVEVSINGKKSILILILSPKHLCLRILILLKVIILLLA